LDAPLAKKIQEVLNGGTLVYPKNTNYLNLLFLSQPSESLPPPPPVLRVSVFLEQKKVELHPPHCPQISSIFGALAQACPPMQWAKAPSGEGGD